MYGRFHQLPDPLFFRRVHSAQSTSVATDRISRTVWFSPEKRDKFLFPHFRQFVEYLSVIRKAPLQMEDRLWCFREMMRWLGTNRNRLFSDLILNGKQAIRPAWRALVAKEGN
jgi:hypothetical protein